MQNIFSTLLAATAIFSTSNADRNLSGNLAICPVPTLETSFPRCDPYNVFWNDHSQLFEAISSNDLEMTKLYLTNGANPNSRDQKNMTAFLWGCMHSDSPTIEALYHAGADVHAVDKDGNGALHFAVRNGQVPDLIFDLVNWGVDVNAPNNAGEFPLTMAVLNKDPHSFLYLCDKGADLSRPSFKIDEGLKYFWYAKTFSPLTFSTKSYLSIKYSQYLSRIKEDAPDKETEYLERRYWQMFSLGVDVCYGNFPEKDLFYRAWNFRILENPYLQLVGLCKISLLLSYFIYNKLEDMGYIISQGAIPETDTDRQLFRTHPFMREIWVNGIRNSKGRRLLPQIKLRDLIVNESLFDKEFVSYTQSAEFRAIVDNNLPSAAILDHLRARFVA